MRALIDTAIPEGDLKLVTYLGIGMVAVPLINGVVGVVQRRATAKMGEGIIYDLRRELFDHLQHMSLGFFTNTKTGELMSRLNSDVVGAQQAVTSTFVSLVANVFTVAATLFIMVRLEWRLTLLAVSILPLFILASRRVGKRLRGIRRKQMASNAEMNAVMQETLSVSGALLVKLFGRSEFENDRFAVHAAEVRDLGVAQATVGALVLHGAGTCLGAWNCRDVLARCGVRDQRHADHRYDRRSQCVPRLVVWTDVCTCECTRGVHHINGVVRACF